MTNCPLKGKVDTFSLCLGCALVNFVSVILSPFISFLTCWLGTKMYYLTSHIVLRNEGGEPNSGCMIRKILWLGKLSVRVKRDFYICIFQTLCFKQDCRIAISRYLGSFLKFIQIIQQCIKCILTAASVAWDGAIVTSAFRNQQGAQKSPVSVLSLCLCLSLCGENY